MIPKNKGVEFGSLLHHLAAEYVANPFSPVGPQTAAEINPDAKDRFPKRARKKTNARRTASRQSARGIRRRPRGEKTCRRRQGETCAEKPAADKHAGKGPAVERKPEKAPKNPPQNRLAKPAEKAAEKASAEKA